jgi:hypothetical protein
MQGNEGKELFRFEEPRQKRIYENLLVVGPGPAAFYRDACWLMSQQHGLFSTAHLVAHLLREIESALRDVLEPLSKLSKSEWLKDMADKGNHKNEIYAILKALDIPENDPIAEAWLRLSNQSNDYRLSRLAHREALAPPRLIDKGFKQLWAEMGTVLDVVLVKFMKRYIAVFDILDKLLVEKKPSQAAIRTLKDHLPKNLVSLGYFFDRMESPEWIIPLKSEGFFSQPPSPQPDNERNVTTFYVWPESRYLARMASFQPETVRQVIFDLPDTDNPLVLADLVQAALNMPVGCAGKLVEKAKRWAQSPHQGILPQKLGYFVVHLANGGEVQGALDLAQELFKVLPDPRSQGVSTAGYASAISPEPKARYSAKYKMILKRTMPDLVKSAGIKAFNFMCDLLESAVRLSQRTDEPQEPDYSYIWCPVLKIQQRHSLDDLKNILVSGVLEAAEQIAQSDANKIPDLVRLLEDRPWRVFHRIALVLLREFHNAVPDLVAARLMDRGLFQDAQRVPEYALLAVECFTDLSEEQKDMILGWIGEGPDLDAYRKAHKEWTGKQLSDDEITIYKEMWQRDHLAWFQSHLVEEWKGLYDILVAKYGEPRPLGQKEMGAGWVGPTSPKSSEELQAMSVSETVEFLKTWEPSDDWMFGPSSEGLGRELSSVVSKDPTRFALEAMCFKGLDPTYVRALLSGLRDAVALKRVFEWSPALELCLWVMSEPREIPGRQSKTWDTDPDWSWTRKMIVELLSEGFKQVEGAIPFNYRSNVWQIICQLTDDPDPTPDLEASHRKSNMDASMVATDTTRGEAMHALMRYALWVRRHLETLPDSSDLLSRGFDEMPEVRATLEKHLDVSYDPSLAIRSVYGHWFPQLVLLDPAWAKDHVEKIFPVDESATAYRDAAWMTYIAHCRAYDVVFDILHDQYGLSVERLEESQEERSRVTEGLAEHLMTFYWRGKISLDDPNGLINRFWIKASNRARGYAMEFLGESLRNTKETIAPEILMRLKSYWERRLEAAKEAPDLCKFEMAAFGHWFVSGKFEDDWAIQQLESALNIAGETYPDDVVVEQLATLALTTPLEAIHCLEAIVEGDKEGWLIYGWEDHARAILNTALQSINKKAMVAAEDLVHYMGSRGYLKFRDLLQHMDEDASSKTIDKGREI